MDELSQQSLRNLQKMEGSAFVRVVLGEVKVKPKERSQRGHHEMSVLDFIPHILPRQVLS
eukprot:8394665-Prorocentrum_lima.AAC.1